MAKVVYEVVEHDGGWAYKVKDVFSERFDSHEEAHAAAEDAAARHELGGETEVISYQDRQGDVHVEVAAGGDRPETEVDDKAESAAAETHRD